MWKLWKSVVLVLGAVVLMMACGFAAFAGALTILMELGTKYHGIYDYYGYTYTALSMVFLFGSGAIGLVTPGVILWRLRNGNVRFSLRTLFIVMTVVAVIAGIYALSL